MSADGEFKRRAPGRDLFPSTHWSVVRDAGRQSEIALAKLCEAYRQPLLVFLCTQGCPPEDAEDGVHGFLVHLLKGSRLARVEEGVGRFRNYLIRALKNHLATERHRRTARKRGGRVPALPLHDAAGHAQAVVAVPTGNDSPDRAFDRAWAQAVLDNALLRMRVECERAGRSAYFATLEPLLFRDAEADQREVGRLLGLEGTGVRSALLRLRTRLRYLVLDEVRRTVADPTETADELRYLIELLGR